MLARLAEFKADVGDMEHQKKRDLEMTRMPCGGTVPQAKKRGLQVNCHTLPPSFNFVLMYMK